MDRIEEVLSRVDRKDFLPAAVAGEASWDTALPIGYGQTNSQPYTVSLMLEWLDAQPGDKVLDVGSGSGWTTALLAYIVGKKGRVYAVERVPELVKFGAENCEKVGIVVSEGATLGTKTFPRVTLGNVGRVSFHQAGREFGLPEEAPFDRILVSASAEELPEELLSQLKIGGKLVIPIENDIYEITRVSKNEYERINHPGFVFVPLVKEY